jgi:malate synthase
VTPALFRQTLSEELDKLRATACDAYEASGYDRAGSLFDELIVNDDFVEFLTIPGYALLE